MRSAKRKVISKPSKTTKPPDRRKNLLPKDPLARQIQKLDKIIEAIRRKENVQVTRLTVVKKLCENPEAAGAFALFLARKSQERLGGGGGGGGGGGETVLDNPHEKQK